MSAKLTDAELKSLRAPQNGQVEHSDSEVPGLRVRIGASGAKTFILRKRVAGRLRNLTVGRYGPRFGLADARRKARQLRSDIETGKTPCSPLKIASSTSGTIRAMMPAYLRKQGSLAVAA